MKNTHNEINKFYIYFTLNEYLLMQNATYISYLQYIYCLESVHSSVSS